MVANFCSVEQTKLSYNLKTELSHSQTRAGGKNGHSDKKWGALFQMYLNYLIMIPIAGLI